MPKLKSHSSASKRFSVTKSGKVKINTSFRRHKLGIKTPKRKRQMRRREYLSSSFTKTIKSLIPND